MVLTLIWWDGHCDTSPVSASWVLRLQCWPMTNCPGWSQGFMHARHRWQKWAEWTNTTIWSLHYGNFGCWPERNVTSEWIRVRAATLHHQGPPVSKYSVSGRQAGIAFWLPRNLNKQTNQADFRLEWCLWSQLPERPGQEDRINQSHGEHRSCLKNKEEIRSLSLSHRHSNSEETASDLETCGFQKLSGLLTQIQTAAVGTEESQSCLICCQGNKHSEVGACWSACFWVKKTGTLSSGQSLSPFHYFYDTRRLLFFFS